MTRVQSHINSAGELLSQYRGEMPFPRFSKQFFSRRKKFGSKDRKVISHLCYCYFRLGKWGQDLHVEERILTGLWLCSTQPNEILAELKPFWNDKVEWAVEKKINLLKGGFSIDEVFPWTNELGDEFDHKGFIISHFRQPELFLRTRPGFEQVVKMKLSNAGVPFGSPIPGCLVLPNSTKLEEILELDKEAVIQDLNSQRVAEFFPPSPVNAWDCCAASGGKSILLKDRFPGIDLTVSDVRESILVNLRKRFSRAGIHTYTAVLADLTKDSLLRVGKGARPDLVVCDAPCTGSGTWSRTPEQLYFFETARIDYYQQLQRKILSNVVPMVDAGGYLLYSTCSVFRKENEENLEWLKSEFGLSVIRAELLKGYDRRADSLFAALLNKSL